MLSSTWQEHAEIKTNHLQFVRQNILKILPFVNVFLYLIDPESVLHTKRKEEEHKAFHHQPEQILSHQVPFDWILIHVFTYHVTG